ncbi:unnamed protein product [Caretta caretta]
MILESPAEKQRRQINLERKCSNPEEVKVKSLCSKYKDFLAEEIVIVSQYNDFKFAVAERLKAQLVLRFPDMVTFVHQNEQFQDLAKLMDIGGTFLASSADCEHGFSLMDTLKNRLRNRLQVDHLDMLMCIKSYQLDGGLIDLDRVYIEWTSEKDCREKRSVSGQCGEFGEDDISPALLSLRV